MMPVRKHDFTIGEHYHCYNRGVDKRVVFLDQQDYVYFLKSLKAYNSVETHGHLRVSENTQTEAQSVTILTYCLLPNHFHILLREEIEHGISQYLKRVLGGYTMYFNQKYKRTGSLFQGPFKSKYVATDQDLRQVLSYVAHNYFIHNISDKELFRSSMNTKDSLVRDLFSNFDTKTQLEAAQIIKEIRDGFGDEDD